MFRNDHSQQKGSRGQSELDGWGGWNTQKVFNGFFFNLFYFLNYENMITRLQETWKTQYKVKIFSWTLSL